MPWDRLLSEPPRPDWVREQRSAPWLAVGTVCIGAFMGQLDASIVTVALPTIARNFHAELGGVEWVVLAYVVVLVGAVAAVGRVADSAGRKLFYAYGFAVFAAASAGCAAAPSLGVLVICRVIQGVGAVMLQANSVALIRDVAPKGRLGMAVGLQGAAQAVGLAAGPSVGGVLIAAGGWPLIFLINVPVGAAGIVLAWLLLPRSRNRVPAASVDVVGTLTLAGAAACLLAALSLAVQKGASAAALGGTSAAAALLGAAALLRQRRWPGAVVDSALLRRRAFTLGSGSALLAYAVLFGTLLVVPFFLEGGLGIDPRGAGLRLTALPVALAAMAPVGGRLADRLGPRLPTVAGMALTALGIALLAAGGGQALLLLALGVAGIGLGLYIPANNAAVVAAAPAGHAGSASGLLNMTRGLGTALGVAVASLVYGLVVGTAAGSPVGPAQASAGLRAAGVVLALGAAAAGVLASMRDQRFA
jgi:EmrB/QacA subfamily drug resistance transporter